jgi:O-antigen ligase
MKTMTLILFIFLFLSFILEFSFGISVTDIKGLSLKNLSIFLIICFMIAGNLVRGIPVLQRNKLNIPIICFILYAFLSMTIPFINNFQGYGSLFSNIINFKNYMDPFIFAIFVYNVVNDSETAEKLMYLLMLLLLVFNIISLLVTFEFIQTERLWMDTRLSRSRGAFSEGIQYSYYVALFMPLAINFFLNRDKLYEKILFGITIIVGIYCIFLTGSRGGFLTLLVSLNALVLLNAKELSLSFIVKTIAFFLIIGVIFLGALHFLPESSKEAMEYNFLERAKQESLDEYSSSRIEMWSYGLKLFLKNPFLGTGWGTYAKLAESNSHNDFLLHLATLGILGFIFFIMIFFRLFRNIWDFRHKPQKYTLYFNAYLAGLISFLVGIFLNNAYAPIYFMFFIYSAIILKLRDLNKIKLRNQETVE